MSTVMEMTKEEIKQRREEMQAIVEFERRVERIMYEHARERGIVLNWIMQAENVSNKKQLEKLSNLPAGYL